MGQPERVADDDELPTPEAFMLLFSALAACTLHDFSSAGGPAPLDLTTDPGADASSEGEQEVRVTAASAPVSLAVTLADGSEDAVLQVIPYRTAGGALTWQGPPLYSEGVTSTSLSVLLPSAPPRADRDAADPGAPVSYAVALRSTNDDGDASVFLGLAEASLVWFPADTDDAYAGWNMIVRYGGEDPNWVDIADGLRMGSNLVAPSELALSGTSVFAPTPDTHIAVTTIESGISVYDQPMTDHAWDLSLQLPPPLDALGEDGVGTALHLYAYEDDGDNRLDGEAIVGEGCVGANVAAVTWYAYAYDLDAARPLQAAGLRSGWDIVRETPEGLAPSNEDIRAAVSLQDGCEVQEP